MRTPFALVMTRLFLLAGGALAQVIAPASAQDARTPIETVDTFHRALSDGNRAAALNLLARDLVVYEFGAANPTLDQYVFAHLPFDLAYAATTQWKVESRRMGGGGDDWWVLTAYRVTGTGRDGAPVNNTTLETMLLHRTNGAFRIVHVHWSTNDPAFNAKAPAP